MGDFDLAPHSSPLASAAAVDPFPSPSPKEEENLQPVAVKVSELNESQVELLSRLRGLKQDLQSWRGNLDTQVKTYKDELSELKSRLHTDLDQLRNDFKDLKIILQKQQDEVNASLRNLGLTDATESEHYSENGKEKPQKSSMDGTEGTELSDAVVDKFPPKESDDL